MLTANLDDADARNSQMTNRSPHSSLDDAHRRQLFAAYLSLQSLYLKKEDQPDASRRPIDFVVRLFEKAFGVDISGAIDLTPTPGKVLPQVLRAETGDLALIFESDNRMDLIPAVVLGIVAKQLIYHSPRVKSLIARDLAESDFVLDAQDCVKYHVVGIQKANTLLTPVS